MVASATDTANDPRNYIAEVRDEYDLSSASSDAAALHAISEVQYIYSYGMHASLSPPLAGRS